MEEDGTEQPQASPEAAAPTAAATAGAAAGAAESPSVAVVAVSETEDYLFRNGVVDDGMIHNGQMVMAQFSSDGGLQQVKVDKKTRTMFGKTRCFSSDLQGQPFGTIFDIGVGKLTRSSVKDLVTSHSQDVGGGAPEGAAVENGSDSPTYDGNSGGGSGSKADNRDLNDDNNAQSVSQAEILKMVQAGVPGADIIEKLKKGSSTWDSKTVFSQQKWMKRMEKKYCPRIRISRITAENLCAMYFSKHQARVMCLNVDTMALILSYANVQWTSRVLMVDSTLGLVTAAVLERLGAGRAAALGPLAAQRGRVLSVFDGAQLVAPAAMEQSNLPDADKTSEVCKEDPFTPTEEDKSIMDQLSVTDSEQEEEYRDYLKKQGTTDPRVVDRLLKKKHERLKRVRLRPTALQKRVWLHQKSDSLIICSSFEPLPVLKLLLPFLVLSGPIVIFCEFVEPLVKCYRFLQDSRKACAIRIANTWYREYQVLPGRTHPQMNMPGSTGFILTATHVEDTETDGAVAVTAAAAAAAAAAGGGGGGGGSAGSEGGGEKRRRGTAEKSLMKKAKVKKWVPRLGNQHL